MPSRVLLRSAAPPEPDAYAECAARVAAYEHSSRALRFARGARLPFIAAATPFSTAVAAQPPAPALASTAATIDANPQLQQQLQQTDEQPQISSSPLAVLPHDYESWPSDEQRMTTGFVGLRNLGATCYMNTSLQHLFTIPLARNAVLLQDPVRWFFFLVYIIFSI